MGTFAALGVQDWLAEFHWPKLTNAVGTFTALGVQEAELPREARGVHLGGRAGPAIGVETPEF